MGLFQGVSNFENLADFLAKDKLKGTSRRISCPEPAIIAQTNAH
jgi:hypothetical protein